MIYFFQVKEISTPFCELFTTLVPPKHAGIEIHFTLRIYLERPTHESNHYFSS